MREPTETAVREARVAAASTLDWRKHWTGLVFGACAALLFALAGAFETWHLSAAPRLAFWLIVMLSGAMLGIGASTGVRAWGGLSHRLVLEGMAVSALIAVPQTLLVTGAVALFFGPDIVTTDRALLLFSAVASVTLVMTAVNYLSDASRRTPGSSPIATPIQGVELASPLPVPTEAVPVASWTTTAAEVRRLSDRLPPRLRNAAIRALEAEDHYIRVHTDAGSDLLLLRLTDAIAELGDVPGARTHRSWWVARDAVARARRLDGRGELVLPDGVVVPVSRSALGHLQREGWFAGASAGDGD